MRTPLSLAVVLHAHLPYVRHAEPFSPQERWLHEAMWECYLPLCALLGDLSLSHDDPLLTLSVSPTLADMLADPLLQRRFTNHLDQVRGINDYQQRCGATRLSGVRSYYRRRLDAAAVHFDHFGSDVLAAVRQLASFGAIELLTTSASHAYLPGWRHAPGGVGLQLALARQWPHGEVQAAGFWLPELAIMPGLDHQLVEQGYRYTMVDDHALQLAMPRVRPGRAALSAAGLVHLARDRHCNERVWSRSRGYPRHPLYREFYRDLGHSAPSAQLGELRHGTMTGLKYYGIGDGGAERPIYQHEPARLQALVDAADFVSGLKRFADSPQQGLIVAAYDAELFGHWWHEGPYFLREVLRLAATDPDIALTTPARYLATDPAVALTEVSASSWGRGGHGAPWTGGRSARWWRPLHETLHIVRRAAFRAGHRTGAAGAALDRAIVELLLLQASDWLFLLNETGEPARYARERLLEHGKAACHFSRMAENPGLASREEAAQAREKRPFMRHVDRGILRRAVMS